MRFISVVVLSVALSATTAYGHGNNPRDVVILFGVEFAQLVYPDYDFAADPCLRGTSNPSYDMHDCMTDDYVGEGQCEDCHGVCQGTCEDLSVDCLWTEEELVNCRNSCDDMLYMCVYISLP